jgi:hypothetical protein
MKKDIFCSFIHGYVDCIQPTNFLSNQSYRTSFVAVRGSFHALPSLDLEHETPTMWKVLLIVICKLSIIYVL